MNMKGDSTLHQGFKFLLCTSLITLSHKFK